MTFGFDSAVACVTDALDRLHTTAASHKRAIVLQVMGRHAGFLTAASALGVHVTGYKLRIFVLAAVLAGTAGACFSVVSQRVDPSLSEFRILVSVLTIAVVGGLGTRFGPIVGAIIVVLLPQVLVSVGELETLVYGLFILVFLLFMPHGLAGLLERMRWAPFWRKRSSAAVEA